MEEVVIVLMGWTEEMCMTIWKHEILRFDCCE
jgi:hypothetical protein